MKRLCPWLLLGALALCHAHETGENIVLVPIGKASEKPRLLFSTEAEVHATAGLDAVTSEQSILYRIHQGNAETLSLGLSGEGEILAVTGEELRDWSVRVAENGARFLDVRPLPSETRTEFQVTVRTRLPLRGDGSPATSLLLPTPADSTGFSLSLQLVPRQEAVLRILGANGLTPVESPAGQRFFASRAAELQFSVAPAGSSARGLELFQASLRGRQDAAGGSLSFVLAGMARAAAEGSRAELFGNPAALSGQVSGEGWHVELRRTKEGFRHDLVADRAGDIPLEIRFEVPVSRRGDWQEAHFFFPAGVIVPLHLQGLAEDLFFDPSQPVVPEWRDHEWHGFLPANGSCAFSWRTAETVEEGALFFSSTETSDVRVGTGLLRQSTLLDVHVLQGKLTQLVLQLEGPAEILAVSGPAVVGWTVQEEDSKRWLAIRLSQPIEAAQQFAIASQTALGDFPVQASALRLTPAGGLRHSGMLRIANEGAVRLSVGNASGLVQLAPEQFPQAPDEPLRQAFVYRFPAAGYHCSIVADRVVSEVAVNESTIYELAETDRRISSDLELDIREAPLREWELRVPAEYAVSSVAGAAVADHFLSQDVQDGMRSLKIVFAAPVEGRQLVRVQLEKNEAAAAGPWQLAPLDLPDAKSRRGFVGAVAAAGYRLEVDQASGLAEVPVSFFPARVRGLQQAFRLKDPQWRATLRVESLEQSVQADVFHLYSLKAGVAYGSVLVNCFVVGAPAHEWRLSLPPGIGNLDVTGQHVGHDWRQEGNFAIIPLTRPLLGAGTVLVTFEQPMNSQGGEFSPGGVHPVNVQSERGFIQVVSPLQVHYDISRSEGSLLALDPSELPAEFRLLNHAPTLGAWQYTARDFSLGMNLTWFEPGATVDQVIDFLRLSSHVARDGQWVTDARMFLRSRNRNALRMKLPREASLWEATVAGASVNLRQDGGSVLLPLPEQADPNQPLEITLRYGARAPDAARPSLGAPVLEAPMVIGQWTVRGDEGRQLVPRGGSAQLTASPLAATGWEWLASHREASLALLLFSALPLLMRSPSAPAWLRAIACLSALLVAIIALGFAFQTLPAQDSRSRTLEYTTTVVTAGHPVHLELRNTTPLGAKGGMTAWLCLASGIAALCYGVLRPLRLAMAAGHALLLAGILSLQGGIPGFLLYVAAIAAGWLARRLWGWFRKAKLSAPASAVGTCLFVMAACCLSQSGAAVLPAESIVQDWQIREGRLYGTMEIAVRGNAQDRFLLLQDTATLKRFRGAGLQVVKAPQEGSDAYFLVLESGGTAQGSAEFEMPLADPAAGWHLPGGPAAKRQVRAQWDRSGWEFASEEAARITAISPELSSGSGAELVFGSADRPRIQARPQQRDPARETTSFYAEVSNLFLPGAGVVNGRHRVVIRPAQGRVSSLTMRIPQGFTVSQIVEGPAGPWRFDPVTQELRVTIQPAQPQPFSLLIETQRGLGSLPANLELAPLHLPEAAGEVGRIALAFGTEAQPETIESDGMSRVDLDDFDPTLIPPSAQGQAQAVLQQAFRYASASSSLRVGLAEVTPAIHADTWQLVSLGEDRLVISTDLKVRITRAGVFALSLRVPDGLEIESVSGPMLSHWTEAWHRGERLLHLHLAGKTLGRADFSLVFSGLPPEPQASWSVPRFRLTEATRENGLLIIVPEQGLQVRAASRNHVSQLDPHELSERPEPSGKAAARPGALAYRLLQRDWELALAIRHSEPWVTAKVLHEATLREGQLLTKLILRYRIENASVKTLQVRIPGLDPGAAATLRAHGPAVADLVPVANDNERWEIRLQRSMAGDIQVILEYQQLLPPAAGQELAAIGFPDVRQVAYFTALRTAGRLELEVSSSPRGWQQTDWAMVQAAFGQVSSPAPLLAYQATDPEGPLTLLLKRHQLADLEKLTVSQGTLTTLLSPRGNALTAVHLHVEVLTKTTLRLKLPAQASLFHVFVNEEAASLVREGNEWLFHVFPPTEPHAPARVRFVYASGNPRGLLESPVLNVPMQQLRWRVLLPEGWRLASHGGDFDLLHQRPVGAYRLQDYQSFVATKGISGSQNAITLLDQAHSWLAQGDQEKASLALSSATRSNLLDEASNEDARVQLRQLRAQQAVLALTTRRQKLFLDNRIHLPEESNPQLEQAAEVNPLFHGGSNYDPGQFNRFLEGNSAEENAALKAIANHMVRQQLSLEPTPAVLDVSLPERGTALTFTRSVQVKGDRPMTLSLELKPATGHAFWRSLPVCLLLAGMAAGLLRREAGRRHPIGTPGEGSRPQPQ